MSQYQIPKPWTPITGAPPAPVQSDVLSVSQPETIAYARLQQQRHLVGTTPFLDTIRGAGVPMSPYYQSQPTNSASYELSCE